MIHAQFTDYIVVQDGKVVRYVEARWPATKTHTAGNVTVYRINDDGKEQVRYLDYRPICGYMVDLDFEDDTWYNVSGSCRALRTGANVCSSPLTEKETRGILTVYPEFKWTLQKAGQVNPAKAMKLLIAWKKDNRTELLVGAHLDNLVANGNFLRMKNERQKAVLAFIRKTPEAERWTLSKILFVMHGRTPDEYDAWLRFRTDWGTCCAFDVFKYLNGYRAGLHMYNDYIRMAKRAGHDVKDPYWKFPKDLKKAHDKVMREVENIRAMKKAEELKKKQTNYIATIKRFLGKTYKGRGVEVFVPDNVQQIEKQAKALHQCLIANNYIDKVIKKEIVLVFVMENGESLATAELICKGRKFELGQFYGDEAKENCNAPRKAQTALKKWAELHKIRMVA